MDLHGLLEGQMYLFIFTNLSDWLLIHSSVTRNSPYESHLTSHALYLFKGKVVAYFRCNQTFAWIA
jgi:hypothetical protein